MPMCIRGIDQIMAERRRDTLFIEFPGLTLFGLGDRRASIEARDQHFRWFRAQNLTWETAAPRGFWEGDPGVYHLHCSPEDARITTYSAKFEYPDGTSLQPEVYRMIVLSYESWHEHFAKLPPETFD